MGFSRGKHHQCPLCESPCNEEIERYVESELYKMVKNPDYIPKPYNQWKREE